MKRPISFLIFLLLTSCFKEKIETKETVDRNWLICQYIGYQFHNQSLKNKEVFSSLLTSVKDSNTLRDINQVRKETKSLISYLHNESGELINNTGGYKSGGGLKNGTDKEYL